MKKIFKKIKGQKITAVLLLFTFFLLTMCVQITGITQPSSVSAGQLIDIRVDVTVVPDDDDTKNLIFGFLAPTSWDVETGTTLTYTSTVGDGTMSLVSTAEVASNSAENLAWAEEMTTLFGTGDNTEEMKWVVFKSDDALTGAGGENITGQVQLKVTVGPNILTTQLAYGATLTDYGFVEDVYGLGYGDYFDVSFADNSLEVSEAVAVTYQPQSYTIDDVITINYDAKEGFSGLLGASQVYLCASAMVGGVLTTVCDNNSALAMTNEGNDMWSLNMWPRNLFNVAVGSTLTDFTFSFTNEAGDVIIRDANTTQDFVLIDNCTN